MKKILIILLFFIFIMGCSNVQNERLSDIGLNEEQIKSIYLSAYIYTSFAATVEEKDFIEIYNILDVEYIKTKEVNDLSTASPIINIPTTDNFNFTFYVLQIKRLL